MSTETCFSRIQFEHCVNPCVFRCNWRVLTNVDHPWPVSSIGAPHSHFSAAAVCTRAYKHMHANEVPEYATNEAARQRLTSPQPAEYLCHSQPCSSGLQYPEFKQHDLDLDTGLKVLPSNGGLIPIQDPQAMIHVYEKAFEKILQTNCRVLAKAYIKLVEPRKQVNYPYNGRKSIRGRTVQLNPEATKPSWWPSHVRHREPGHLLKVGTSLRFLHYMDQVNLHRTYSTFSSHYS